MNPEDLKKAINEALRDNILDTLVINSGEGTCEAVKKAAENYDFVTEPFIEQQPLYKLGSSLEYLISEGLLHKITAQLFALSRGIENTEKSLEEFYHTFHLYEHQQHALEKVCKNGKNLIVCSGTGSGKTECFILPLLDYLVREKVDHQEKGIGVRALLLYPMNALVNDQLRRLRGILKYCQDVDELKANPITFGRFTGETPTKEKKEHSFSTEEKNKAEMMLNDAPVGSVGGLSPYAICPNEVTRRSQWCNKDAGEKGPADILVTNYSMLERLLLKPDTSAIFERGNFWKFIILDEAHSYDGSKGTEIAWLIRRLRQRVKVAGELCFIATSATLIDGEAENLRQALKVAKVSDNIWKDEKNPTQLKSIFIKYAFAAQIFPASAESFCVEFGVLEEEPTCSSYSGNKTVQDYIKRIVPPSISAQVNELDALKRQLPKSSDNSSPFDSFQEFLPWFWGVDSFWNCGKEQLKDSINNNKCIAGDALNLFNAMLRMSNALEAKYKLNEKESIVEQLKKNSVLAEDSTVLAEKSKSLFSWILSILGEDIAPLCKDDVEKSSWADAEKEWGKILNDELDVSLNLNSKNEYGNQLDVLDEWVSLKKGELDKLTIRGLGYLLNTGHECILNSDYSEYSPFNMPLYISSVFKNYIQKLQDDVDHVCEIINDIKKALLADIVKYFEIKEQNDGSIEKYLGHILLARDSDYLRLRKHINKCHDKKDGLTPADSKFSTVAKKLFLSDSEDKAKEKLNTLNIAASFSKDQDERPLWDIRYHQMIRGVPAATIDFQINKDNDDNTLSQPNVEFCVNIINQTGSNPEKNKSLKFTLGLCLKCGLPYIIGYAKNVSIPSEDNGLQLYPYSSNEHQYTHAFSWCINKDNDSEEENEDKDCKFLNPYTGKIYNEYIQGSDLVASRYYAKIDNEKTHLITHCPCCGSHREGGIIINYSNMGDSNKSVAIAAILKQLPPSSNPEARAYSGLGRKLIAFSDSRIKSAKLALDFDRYIIEHNTDRLLYVALREKNRLSREEDELESPPSENSLRSLGLAFRDEIEKNDLREQYLLLDYEAKPAQMKALDAAIAQLIKSLRRNGSHKMLDRAGGYMDYCKENKDKLLGSLGKRAKQDNLKFDQTKAELAFREILYWLFSNGKIMTVINEDEYFPDAIVNPGYSDWYKTISKEEKNTISFKRSTKLQKLMKSSLSGNDNDIKKCLEAWFMDDVWREFTEGRDRLIKEKDKVLRPLCSKLLILPNDSFDAQESKLPPLLSARIEEHSGQISSTLGRVYQNAFSSGKINVLSCSTTFEMGVDLGDLSCVFLSNQPPTVANYKQRAGRAGRRAGMGAMVWTFIGMDAHDSYYFEHPEEMFFGQITPPLIYLDNPVFKARHLRAEALHRFLKWKVETMNGKDHKRWESVGWFFFGISTKYEKKEKKRIGIGFSDSWVCSLEQWAREEQKSSEFEDIIKRITENNQDVDYDVVKDLVWQLQGILPPSPEMTRDMCYRLAGPNMNDDVDISLYNRMFQQLLFQAGMPSKSSHNDFEEKYPENSIIESSLSHLFRESTIDYLSRNRILPLYGFPADVIELKKDRYDKTKVELSRDMRQGIYEYAPSSLVMANKRVFVSERAIFYNSPQTGEKGGELDSSVKIARVCASCGKSIDEQDQSSLSSCCSSKIMDALRPDAFQAKPSTSGQNYNYLDSSPYMQRTPGETKEGFDIPKTEIKVSENKEKKVIYLNTNKGEGFSKSKNGNGNKYCLIHTVHTDVLQLKLSDSCSLPKDWDDKRKENTCYSVAAALKRAMQIVLRVQKEDVGILSDCDLNSWSLFDTSSGGSGFIYRLLLSKETANEISSKEKEIRIDLIKSIVKEALNVCKGNKSCHCYDNWKESESKNLIPGDLGDIIDDPDNRRPRYSCYSCLRDFTNKKQHDKLDVSDAIVMLELMLGDAKSELNLN